MTMVHVWLCTLCGGKARRVAVRRGSVMMPIRRSPACEDCFEQVDMDLKAPVDHAYETYAWLDEEQAKSDKEAARALIVASVMER